jgi:hypothetical protein
MKPFSSPLLIFFALLGLTPNLASAAAGDLYQVAFSDGIIYKYEPNATRTTFASNLQGTSNYLAFNRRGDLFVNEGSGNTGIVSKFTPAGSKTTFVTGVSTNGLACDAAGNLFVLDTVTQSIIRVTPAGARSTFASGVDTLDLVFDAAGNLYTADFGNGADGQGKIYKYAPDGTRTTFASGLNRPNRLAIDAAQNLFMSNTDGVILRFAPGSRSTFASGLGNIQGLACDASRNLFVSVAVSNSPGTDTGIFKFTPIGAKTPFAFTNLPSAIAFEPARSQPVNIATRLRVQTGDNALIAGFIITGNAPKPVLLRGIGPSLGALGIAGPLQDPIIELRNSAGAFVNGNNNWKDTQSDAIAATGIPPTDDRESALLITLGPGAWTVVMRGISNSTGIGVVEVYDLNQAADSKLANISTRGFVETGDNVMIGGLIIGSGNGAGKIVARAIGPSLANVGISGALSDPTLSLRDGNGMQIAFNDDWGFVFGSDSSSRREIEATGVAPSHERESAIVATLPNGNYTVIVAGYQDATGIGSVEIYNLQ